MNQKILIIDYGMGNLNSVKKKLAGLGADVTVSKDPFDISYADKLILPGVGHFKKAVENLKAFQLWEILNEMVLIKQKPILGICLGMQLMASGSEEGNVEGLNWFDADVVKFRVQNKLMHKIPHTGWNQISQTKKSVLLKQIPDQSEFYFVHSFHYQCKDKSDILCQSEYEYEFTSAVEKENIFGVQFHPEKSHDVGERLLKNFKNL